MQTTVDPDATAVAPVDADPAAEASDDTRRLGAETVLADFGRVLGSARCAGSQRLVRLGISMTHFHVLTLLRHHDAMPMGRLAEILDVSLSNATGVIDRMEERGLVERVRVPDDRRVVLVTPTSAGLALVDEVELVKSELITAALGRLQADQLDRLIQSVAELRAAIEGELSANPDSVGPLGGCTHSGQPHAHHAHHAHPVAPTS